MGRGGGRGGGGVVDYFPTRRKSGFDCVAVPKMVNIPFHTSQQPSLTFILAGTPY